MNQGAETIIIEPTLGSARTSSFLALAVPSRSKLFGGEVTAPAESSSLSHDRAVTADASSLPREILDPLGWQRLADDWQRALEAAKDEVFEDGVQGPFARELRRFLLVHASNAIEFLQNYSFAEGARFAIVAEILRYVGMDDDLSTREARLQLLIRHLGHSSPTVRDASGIGLAHMNDRRALSHLRNAVRRERYPELRDDLALVVKQLES